MASTAPPRITLRVDHDAGPGLWRVDCQTCGSPLAAGVVTDSAAAVAGAAWASHACLSPGVD